MEFVKYKTDYAADSVFFNLLRITNNNGKDVQGTLRFGVPAGWQLISLNEIPVKVNVGQTITIPVRLSLARNSMGGVSYVVSATLSSDRSLYHNKNQNSASAFFYITVPRKTQWDVHPAVRMVYFDQFAEYANLELKVSNKGNGYQPIKIEISTGAMLEMFGSFEGKFTTAVQLKPHQDSVLFFPLRKSRAFDQELNVNRAEGMLVRIKAQADSSVRYSSVTFKSLESYFYNELGNQHSPLTVEMQIQNLLSIYNPSIFLSAYGNLELKNTNHMDYSWRIPMAVLYNDVSPNTWNNSLWERSRMRVSYFADKWKASAGDVSTPGIPVLGGGGRGVSGSYDINATNRVGAGVTSAVVGSYISGSVFHQGRIKDLVDITSGACFALDNYNRMSNYGLYSQGGLSFAGGHHISVLLAGSQMNHLYDNQSFSAGGGNYVITNDPGKSFYGFSTQVQYGFQNQKLHANLSTNFTSRHFSQYNNGHIEVNGLGRYIINQKYYLTSNVNMNSLDPSNYFQGVLYPQRKLVTGRYDIEGADIVNRRLTLFAGPLLDHVSVTSLNISKGADSTRLHLTSYSPQISLRLNYKGSYRSTVNPYFIPGYTLIYSTVDSLTQDTSYSAYREYFRARAGTNIIQKFWGVNVSYDYGPVDQYGQVDYIFFRSYGRTLRIAPYYERYFLDKRMLFSSRNSYAYSMPANSERMNLNGRFTFYPDRSWTFYVDNNIFSYSQVNKEGQRLFNRRFYVGFGVKKIFDIPQPGVKYYDVKIVCFRDNNGNKKKDENEIGIPDVVISFARETIRDSVTHKPIGPRGKFAAAEVVTNAVGEAFYYKLLGGETKLDVIPLFNLKEIQNINGQKQNITVTTDTTIYIPFAQTFRVIGNIIINRDPYSSLGAISPANIRVLATDSAGVSFPALSGSDGSYVIYVPQAGEYKISANNIFGDKLQLQESEFVLSFDGAKEFKVDFIYNEKKRAINVNSTNPPAPAPAATNTVQVNPAPANTNTVQVDPALQNKKDSASSASPVTPSTDPAVTYRVQLGSNATRVPKAQYAVRFKGADKVQEYAEDGMYKYTSGEFNTFEFEKATEYKNKLIALGFKDAFVAFFKGGKRIK